MNIFSGMKTTKPTWAIVAAGSFNALSGPPHRGVFNNDFCLMNIHLFLPMTLLSSNIAL